MGCMCVCVWRVGVRVVGALDKKGGSDRQLEKSGRALSEGSLRGGGDKPRVKFLRTALHALKLSPQNSFGEWHT